MAGGKLSPRQKMINMMYLVLLALLAMNVSAEILDAFEQIKQKLNVSASTAQSNNNDFVSNMNEKINEELSEGKEDNKGLVDTIQLIQNQTNELLSLIQYHMDTLDQIAGIDKETGKLLKKDETEKNYQYWMGAGNLENENEGRGAGAGYELHQKLDGFIDELFKIYNSQIPDSLAQNRIDPASKYLTNDPEATLDGESKTWENYTFHGPVIANLALMESLKLDLFEREKEVLEKLNERLGVNKFKVDSVIALDAPFSTVVPAGLQFKTRLFVTMASQQVIPQYSSGSGSIEKDGVTGILTMNASGSVIPKGRNEGKQSYSATVRVPKANGGFELKKVEGEFTVRKPEIVITSAAVQTLYRACANEVNIDVPALGDFYNPVIRASNGTAENIKGKGKKVWRIVPTGRKSVVSVSSNTNGQTVKIGDVNYRVIEPPKPSVNMAVNGKIYNGASMVPKTSRVAVRIEPDADFKAALPKDARYGIRSIDVLAQLSLGPPAKVNAIRGSKNAVDKPIAVSLGTQVRQSRPGTKVYVRLNDIYRTNYKGQQIVDKRFTEVERTLSLVVK
ncbi:MAG: hypothetical protein AAFU33_15610 [Bacteroidota bacterium]